MAFGSFEQQDEIEANAEINMVPFIDVMLVLLIIFMITAPLVSHAVKVDLPKVSSQVLSQKQKPVEVTVLANGQVLINGETASLDALPVRLKAFDAETELHLRADKQTPYDSVAKVLAAAAEAGLTRIGFVTEPKS